VAERNGYSKSNFCRVFKRITGNTFHDILNQRRVEVAGFLLVQTNLDLEEIAQQVGFLDAKCFCRVFKKYTGKTPGTYRKQ
jgi:YesN/AraC family two-component response regulator